MAVPLNVMLAVVPEQIEVVPDIDAVGKAFTVTIIGTREPAQPFESTKAT